MQKKEINLLIVGCFIFCALFAFLVFKTSAHFSKTGGFSVSRNVCLENDKNIQSLLKQLEQQKSLIREQQKEFEKVVKLSMDLKAEINNNVKDINLLNEKQDNLKSIILLMIKTQDETKKENKKIYEEILKQNKKQLLKAEDMLKNIQEKQERISQKQVTPVSKIVKKKQKKVNELFDGLKSTIKIQGFLNDMVFFSYSKDEKIVYKRKNDIFLDEKILKIDLKKREVITDHYILSGAKSDTIIKER
jgi:predicted MPP superfamily phosphohydrolase